MDFFLILVSIFVLFDASDIILSCVMLNDFDLGGLFGSLIFQVGLFGPW